jgi:hypothetical protein
MYSSKKKLEENFGGIVIFLQICLNFRLSSKSVAGDAAPPPRRRRRVRGGTSNLGDVAGETNLLNTRCSARLQIASTSLAPLQNSNG